MRFYFKIAKNGLPKWLRCIFQKKTFYIHTYLLTLIKNGFPTVDTAWRYVLRKSAVIIIES